MTTPEPTHKGPYQLLEIIGKGGMGVVHRALDTRTQQTVAVKTLRVKQGVPVTALRREIAALARLRHPGIVRIFDHGIDSDGAPWYAMELFEATSLRVLMRTLRRDAKLERQDTQRLVPAGGDTGSSDQEVVEDTVVHEFITNDARLTGAEDTPTGVDPRPAGAVMPVAVAPANDRRLLGYIVQLCDALAYLHGEGLVHRDLKPENILVTDDDRVVLVDFGLAIDPTALPSTESVSVEHAMSGTAYYMAPEQLLGRVVDARTDLYALGCIIHIALTHRPPFGGKIEQILRGHIVERPRSLTVYRPDLSPALDEIVLSLLSKNVEERPGYAEDIARALQPFADLPAHLQASPTPRPYLNAAKFVGHRTPATLLRARLEQVIQGEGSVIAVSSAAGLGKTRLAVDLVHEAYGRPVVVLTGRCEPTGPYRHAAPLSPLRKALSALAKHALERSEPGEVAEQLRVLADYEPTLLGLPGVDSEEAPSSLSHIAAVDRLSRVVTELFADLASEHPILFVLDDLQWADALTLDWLDYVIRSLERSPFPLLLVMLARPDGSGQYQEIVSRQSVQKVALQPLQRSELRALVSSMMASPNPPANLLRFLEAHAGGNPLFTSEFLRAAVVDGHLYRDESGEWHLLSDAADLRHVGLPTGLEGILTQRLEHLDPNARSVAEILAVVGQRTDMTLLDVFVSSAGDALMVLMRDHIIELDDYGGVVFASRSMREAVYRSMNAPTRQAIHRRVAEVLTEHSSAGPDEIARHWLEADEFLRGMGCLLEAARLARLRADIRSEREALQTWCDLDGRHELGISPRQRTEVQARLARAAIELGETATALRLAEAVATQAAQLNMALTEGRAVFIVGSVLNTTGDIAGALEALARADTIFEEVGAYEDLANLRVKHAQILGFSGRYEEARGLAASARELFETINDRRGAGLAIAVMGSLANNIGLYERGCELLLEALAIHREVGDRFAEALSLTNLSHEYVSVGQVDDALTLALEALELHQDIGRRHTEGVTLDLLAFIQERRGELDEASEYYRRSEAILREVQSRTFRAYLHLSRAAFHRRIGATDAGLADLEEASFLESLDDPYSSMQLACERGYWLLSENRSAADYLATAREHGAAISAVPDRWPGSYLAGLEAAQRAYLNGVELWQGEHPDALPPGLRKALAARRQR